MVRRVGVVETEATAAETVEALAPENSVEAYQLKVTQTHQDFFNMYIMIMHTIFAAQERVNSISFMNSRAR